MSRILGTSAVSTEPARERRGFFATGSESLLLFAPTPTVLFAIWAIACRASSVIWWVTAAGADWPEVFFLREDGASLERERATGS